MFKSATRIAPSLSRAIPRAHAARRFVSTAPPHQKSRTWRSSALRWGLAGALVYYYNTASVFAEEPEYAIHAPPDLAPESNTSQTVASISEQRRAQKQSQPTPSSSQPRSQSSQVAATPETAEPTSPGALEEEASEQGAFNEETGEINWDCPCLGGMAYGPCGEQFRAAFSCFVFSKEEPKGVDCIEHFKTMQNCFREHPDVYGAELEDDEASPADAGEGQAVSVASQPESAAQAPAKVEAAPESSTQQVSASRQNEQGRVSAATEQVKRDHNEPKSETDEVVPKAWHDGRQSA